MDTWQTAATTCLGAAAGAIDYQVCKMFNNSADTNSTADSHFSSWQVGGTGSDTVTLRTGEQGAGTDIILKVGITGAIGAFIDAASQWWSFPSPKKVSHELHKFRYVHQKMRVGLGPSQNLAPLDEEISVYPKKALRHLRKLLRNKRYRAFQLKMINSVNRKLGVKEVTFNEEKVRKTLHDYATAVTRAREEAIVLRRGQAKAEKLLAMFLNATQKRQLKKERRIEIVARNGNIYEILEDGHVNKLLPDGEKQGLCIIPKKGPYPVADVILAKKQLLELDPDKFDEIANKTSVFVLPKVRA